MDASLEKIHELHQESIIDVAHPAGGVQPLAILNKANVEEDIRAENVARNMKRDVFRFNDLPLFIKRNEPIAIVGGGPSLPSQIDKIKTFPNILVAGSAHDYLVSQGVTPSFALVCDASDSTIDYYRNPQFHTSYLLASQCSPALFDHLKDHKIAMWHFNGQVDEKHFQGERAIGWGCMVTIVAISIVFHLGFQEFHFFGLDCSMNGKSHAYEVEQEEQDHIREISGEVFVGEKQTRFISTAGLLLQADEFFRCFKGPDGKYWKAYVYGDGLLAETIRQSPPEMSRWIEAC